MVNSYRFGTQTRRSRQFIKYEHISDILNDKWRIVIDLQNYTWWESILTSTSTWGCINPSLQTKYCWSTCFFLKAWLQHASTFKNTNSWYLVETPIGLAMIGLWLVFDWSLIGLIVISRFLSQLYYNYDFLAWSWRIIFDPKTLWHSLSRCTTIAQPFGIIQRRLIPKGKFLNFLGCLSEMFFFTVMVI